MNHPKSLQTLASIELSKYPEYFAEIPNIFKNILDMKAIIQYWLSHNNLDNNHDQLNNILQSYGINLSQILENVIINNETFVSKVNLNNKIRKCIHKLCEILHLKSKSLDYVNNNCKKKNKKKIKITKPDNWSWKPENDVTKLLDLADTINIIIQQDMKKRKATLLDYLYDYAGMGYDSIDDMIDDDSHLAYEIEELGIEI